MFKGYLVGFLAMQTSAVPEPLAVLHRIRSVVGRIDTPGLSDEEIVSFLDADPLLQMAIEEAAQRHEHMAQEFPTMYLGSDETELIHELQDGFVNFYNPATVNPYVALAARGPWIITSHGAVVHDNGGYGMLGAGHGPSQVIQSMADNWVMANVMTASFSQKRLDERLRQELGHTRGWCPFDKFICMNSGSESVTVSLRIADVNAKIMTQPGGKHAGKTLSLIHI